MTNSVLRPLAGACAALCLTLLWLFASTSVPQLSLAGGGLFLGLALAVLLWKRSIRLNAEAIEVQSPRLLNKERVERLQLTQLCVAILLLVVSVIILRSHLSEGIKPAALPDALFGMCAAWTVGSLLWLFDPLKRCKRKQSHSPLIPSPVPAMRRVARRIWSSVCSRAGRLLGPLRRALARRTPEPIPGVLPSGVPQEEHDALRLQLEEAARELAEAKKQLAVATGNASGAEARVQNQRARADRWKARAETAEQAVKDAALQATAAVAERDRQLSATIRELLATVATFNVEGFEPSCDAPAEDNPQALCSFLSLRLGAAVSATALLTEKSERQAREIGRLGGKIGALRRELPTPEGRRIASELADTVAAQRSALEERGAEISHLQEALDRLSAEHDERGVQVAKLEEERTRLQAEIVRLEEALGASQEAARELERDRDQLREALARLEAELETQRAANLELTQARDALNEKLTAALESPRGITASMLPSILGDEQLLAEFLASGMTPSSVLVEYVTDRLRAGDMRSAELVAQLALLAPAVDDDNRSPLLEQTIRLLMDTDFDGIPVLAVLFDRLDQEADELYEQQKAAEAALEDARATAQEAAGEGELSPEAAEALLPLEAALTEAAADFEQESSCRRFLRVLMANALGTAAEGPLAVLGALSEAQRIDLALDLPASAHRLVLGQYLVNPDGVEDMLDGATLLTAVESIPIETLGGLFNLFASRRQWQYAGFCLVSGHPQASRAYLHVRPQALFELLAETIREGSVIDFAEVDMLDVIDGWDVGSEGQRDARQLDPFRASLLPLLSYRSGRMGTDRYNKEDREQFRRIGLKGGVKTADLIACAVDELFLRNFAALGEHGARMLRDFIAKKNRELGYVLMAN